MNKEKVINLSIIFLLFISIVLPVNADTLDFNKTGTIELNLKENKEMIPISDVEITIYQVANSTSMNNNLIFEYHENLSHCEANLSNLEDENLSKEINKCIKGIELPTQTKKTNSEGKVIFDELRLGLYLVKQTNEVEGYSNIDEFLVMIPKAEDSKWIYSIKAKPKTDIIKVIDLSVEKVWNNSSKIESHPKSVTIELYKGNELIDTIILNENNNWIHTWKRIELSDEYSVKEINIPDEYTASYRKEDNKFIVTNTKTLVQTGTNILKIELLAMLGTIFIIIGIIFDKRKKIYE